MIGRDANKTWEYVCEADRAEPAEKQTVFTLGMISARAHAAIGDSSLVFGPNGRVRQAKQLEFDLLSLAYGLKGVRNFRDATGKEIAIAWSEGPGGVMVATEFLDRIPTAVRAELAFQIIKGNSVDAEDRKN